ncbi:Arc family DNA-binding protein [Bordetella bronchiseptica]|uniref:Arc family DNA-binding protein n=1 Tax=Bordetella bronchiseptica TaxID=518 RepID=UPI0009B88499
MTRFPRDIRDWLAASAVREHRSMNGQVVAVVERAMAQERCATAQPQEPRQ